MANIGQTIIIRTDIFNLPEDMGLMAAQVAHIHFESMRQHILDTKRSKLDLTPSENMWIKEPYLFVKKVPNIEGLNHFKHLAWEAKLPVTNWVDTVYVRLSPTMKKAFPNTLVGISIGPADADAIRTVVGDLPLL